MSTLNSQLDLLIHVVTEADLSDEERITSVRRMFPHFNPDPKTHTFDKRLDDLALDLYAHRRSLGLSINQCAYALGMSSILLTALFEGKFISLNKFVKLAQAELFATSSFKQTHLRNIEEHSNADWRASIALLEKVLPEDYSPRAEISHTVSNALGAEQCESKALKAQKDLEALRKKNSDL